MRVIGPDPCDVGGIAELKWIAEFADLHGVMMAPHGPATGCWGWPRWCRCARRCRTTSSRSNTRAAIRRGGIDIVDGLPDPIVRNGRIEVWDRPGMGVEINPEKARPYLAAEEPRSSTEPDALRIS